MNKIRLLIERGSSEMKITSISTLDLSEDLGSQGHPNILAAHAFALFFELSVNCLSFSLRMRCSIQLAIKTLLCLPQRDWDLLKIIKYT